ncbi:gas vesicle accessory protein GvpU [Sphingomonas sp. PP-CC-1A-547]|uniref:gas vesicle accessory protein GvpU n=1 Tax=Sphingomonas sp. PP-CC-1A-547 TaxID=2135654 RepID=UPI000FF143EB|nr:gas vesicle accessory protein GvpU [Sphingomonas sp. PP-CC-1A-547]RKE49988.1 hypothetical protein C8J39_1546 [Sphingomonas sp. PP-CC-1A-547]
MSEETDASNKPAQIDDGHPDTTDWFLRSIIETYTNDGVEIGLTLTVGGSVVSGLLISGKTYFKELKRFLTESSGQAGDLFATMADDFGELGPYIYDKPSDAADDWKPKPTGFVHLKDARFHAPGQRPMPTKTSFLWRGKLEAIDGFFIGCFTD